MAAVTEFDVFSLQVLKLTELEVFKWKSSTSRGQTGTNKKVVMVCLKMRPVKRGARDGVVSIPFKCVLCH